MLGRTVGEIEVLNGFESQPIGNFVSGSPTKVEGRKVNWLENQLTKIGEYDDGLVLSRVGNVIYSVSRESISS